jgi:hypothetical protein
MAAAPAVGHRQDAAPDTAATVLAQEDWELVRLSAIAEEDETIVVDNPLGQRCLERRRGKALHPAREPLAMLEQTRKTIGEYNFAGQYRPAPLPLGGGLVKAGWFRHYAAEDVPQFERVVQSWEPRARPRSSAITAFAQAGDIGQEPLSDRRIAPPHGSTRSSSARCVRNTSGSGPVSC